MEEARLREMYVEQEMSYREIAEEEGCSKMVPEYWCDKYGIERRDSRRDSGPNFHHDADGYTLIRSHSEGETQRFVHNRLLATLLVDDLGELEDMDVHHKLDAPGFKPDFLGNLEVLSRSDHRQLHEDRKKR